MVEDKESDKKIGGEYVWIPAVVSFLSGIVILGLKLSEQKETSWSWVIWAFIIVVFVTFGLSIGIFLFNKIRNKRSSERKFHTRAECDVMLRKEAKSRFGYRLGDFTHTGDSFEGSGWFGESTNKDKIYYALYRIEERGAKKRYLLACQNMEYGDEDMVAFEHSPMSFAEIKMLREEMCNRLCKYPQNVEKTEKKLIDEVSGRMQVEKTEKPVQKKEEEDED